MQKGLHAIRLQREPLEKAFAETWEEVNELRSVLAYLLSKKNDRDQTIMTERDEVVAATVIQWLGSCVGQAFLREVQGPSEV